MYFFAFVIVHTVAILPVWLHTSIWTRLAVYDNRQSNDVKRTIGIVVFYKTCFSLCLDIIKQTKYVSYCWLDIKFKQRKVGTILQTYFTDLPSVDSQQICQVWNRYM
jgi:hypothetical protein